LEQWVKRDKDSGRTDTGTAELYKRIVRLIKGRRREAVLVNLRLVQEYVQSASVRMPWVPPPLQSTDLTDDAIDLTLDDDHDDDRDDDPQLISAVISVDVFCKHFSEQQVKVETPPETSASPSAPPPTAPPPLEHPAVHMKLEDSGNSL
jgi:hypothetical protein